jgi:hypothetical protein
MEGKVFLFFPLSFPNFSLNFITMGKRLGVSIEVQVES